MMKEKDKEPHLAPRSATDIFRDLRKVSHRDGAIHEISALIYRDWVVTVDMQEARVTNDPEHRWSTEKLSKNELLLLVGLAVQSPSDRTFRFEPPPGDFAATVDRLLRELHDQVLTGLRPLVGESGELVVPSAKDIGLFAREAIYYGAESFYLHQFAHFARNRYRDDADWLRQHAGLSIRPMLDIAKFICGRVNNQMSAVGHLRSQGQVFSPADLTNSLIIAKDDLERHFGDKAAAFLAKFAIPATGANSAFTDPFAINGIAIAPLVDLGEFIWVPNQYRLMEAIYEGPFYWMMADEQYKKAHAISRGRFLERTANHILTKVFGPKHVHQNVMVGRRKKTTGGEIDALVVYGEFVLVVQAKSKRVRLAARAGDGMALEEDFGGAIQAPYEQALDCIGRIRSGEPCLDPDGKPVALPTFPRFSPVVLLSDPFPSITLLSDRMLRRPKGITPIIWDIGMLDCVTRMLPEPIDLLFFLQARAAAFESVISDSEYNFLGFHLRTKLAMPGDANFLMIDRDFATVVDDFMVARDMGLDPAPPEGILAQIDIPIVTDILNQLRAAPPEMAGPVVDLYNFSHASLENIGRQIATVRDEVRKGKPLKAFSILTPSGGFTFASVNGASQHSRDAAQAIGRKHKYDNRRDRWYVLLDDVRTDLPFDGLLPIVWPWVEDAEESALALRVEAAFKTQWQPTKS